MTTAYPRHQDHRWGIYLPLKSSSAGLQLSRAGLTGPSPGQPRQEQQLFRVPSLRYFAAHRHGTSYPFLLVSLVRALPQYNCLYSSGGECSPLAYPPSSGDLDTARFQQSSAVFSAARLYSADVFVNSTIVRLTASNQDAWLLIAPMNL